MVGLLFAGVQARLLLASPFLWRPVQVVALDPPGTPMSFAAPTATRGVAKDIGYGDAHAEMLIGDWGRYNMADLLQAIDVATEQGLADASRVASFGLSGGGYLTSWLFNHTDRFRAGISECLVSD